MGEIKPKPINSLRSPQPKKKLGLTVPTALRLPHDDLIKPQQIDTPVTPVTVVTPVTPVTGVTGDAAPKKDFTRVANSVVRDAIPAGLFTGKGKQLYDYLYSQTRGAIVPKRSERIPTDKVMRGAGMTRHTYRAHLQRLVLSGLVNVEEKGGEHGGNLFTVYLPEEIGIERGHRGDRGDRGVTVQDLHMVQGSEPDRGDRGLFVDNTDTFNSPKTSFKTLEKNFDDEAFAKSLREVERELTGKESAAQVWEPLFELLSAELKIAAARTTVSSVPAFLTEHLRRRLWKLEKKQLDEQVLGDKTTEPELDASQCLDCGATGWWYPNGADKGVARCTHQKLRSEST